MLSPRLDAESMNAISPFPYESGPNAVEVTECLGEWFVRVTENGTSSVASFELESYASAFSEGQRIRLGLAQVVRV